MLLLWWVRFAPQARIFGFKLVMKPVKLIYFPRLQRLIRASLISSANPLIVLGEGGKQATLGLWGGGDALNALTPLEPPVMSDTFLNDVIG